MNTDEQNKIKANVEIKCALGKMSIKEGIKQYQDNGLQNAISTLNHCIRETKLRLIDGEPASGANIGPMFQLLFELGDEKSISNFILALEQEIKNKFNKKVSEEIDNARQMGTEDMHYRLPPAMNNADYYPNESI